MIKTFTYAVNGQDRDFCATFADGPDGARAIFSAAESPETLVIMEAEGTLAAIKVKLESVESLLNDAIHKAKEGRLIDRALETGTVQTGRL
jgi:hypothetical protein